MRLATARIAATRRRWGTARNFRSESNGTVSHIYTKTKGHTCTPSNITYAIKDSLNLFPWK